MLRNSPTTSIRRLLVATIKCNKVAVAATPRIETTKVQLRNVTFHTGYQISDTNKEKQKFSKKEQAAMKEESKNFQTTEEVKKSANWKLRSFVVLFIIANVYGAAAVWEYANAPEEEKNKRPQQLAGKESLTRVMEPMNKAMETYFKPAMANLGKVLASWIHGDDELLTDKTKKPATTSTTVSNKLASTSATASTTAATPSNPNALNTNAVSAQLLRERMSSQIGRIKQQNTETGEEEGTDKEENWKTKATNEFGELRSNINTHLRR